ncbi:MAG TPA: NAD(P)-binding domain-containing protein, partial [Burkholderiaceae bacterium]
MKIGFIGLGIMGAPMALHLVNAGHTLFVSAARKVPASIQATAAVQCANPAEVARQSEIVFLMVPDT